MLLDQNRIYELHAAAIGAHLDRSALLSAIDPGFVSSLPIATSPSAQLLSDLHALNAVPTLADGSVPLHAWLQNAAALARPRVEASVFERARHDLPAAPSRATPGSKATSREAQREAEATAPERGSAARGGSGPAGTPGAPLPVQVFVSAAPQDRRFVEALSRHLAVLQRDGQLELWDRARLLAGERLEVARSRLDAADVVLLLVSASFLANEETYGEAQRAMDLRARRGTRVIPVLVSPADWHSSAFGGLSALPRSGRALTAWSDADAAYVEIASSLRDIVRDMRARGTP